MKTLETAIYEADKSAVSPPDTKGLFLAFLVDWEDDGHFIAVAAPDTKEEAVEAVTGALKNHSADTVGYVVPVEFAARGTLA